MTARLPWPRSLPSQMALLIALALFAGQVVNFALIYQGRAQLLQQTVVSPAVTRYVDAVERLTRGEPLEVDWPSHISLVKQSPVRPGAPNNAAIESAVGIGLREAGMGSVAVRTEFRPVEPHDPFLQRFSRERAERFRRFGAVMIIAMEWPGHGWLTVNAPWPRSDAGLIWQLIGQTLIIYAIILLPVLWATRRISLPLQRLALATRNFQPGIVGDTLPEAGPNDVRAVIVAFNALRLRVTAMLDEKDRMLGAIGHDLRTPLAALRVRIESVEDEADRARMADTIAEMNRTLDDILSLARLGRPSEPIVEVDLPALVDAVVEDFRDLGQPVNFAPADRITLPLRPSLMRRAVRNLIENAIKYGSVADVRLELARDHVAILIEDRGPGIPVDHLEHVFDPFTRLEGSRNRETGGIGLGLALAKAIVLDARGDISLANRPDGGLEARIALPLAQNA